MIQSAVRVLKINHILDKWRNVGSGWSPERLVIFNNRIEQKQVLDQRIARKKEESWISKESIWKGILDYNIRNVR